MSVYPYQIMAWSGLATTIPSGWQICNGTNGTPDLRGAFVYGKIDNSDSPITGGSATHIHAGGDVEYVGSSHRHSYSGTLLGKAGTGYYYNSASTETYAKANHTHPVTGNTEYEGWNHKHTVTLASATSMPEYIMLYYIMRLP